MAAMLVGRSVALTALLRVDERDHNSVVLMAARREMKTVGSKASQMVVLMVEPTVNLLDIGSAANLVVKLAALWVESSVEGSVPVKAV